MAVRWGKTATDLSQADQALQEGFDFLQLAGDPTEGLSEEELLLQKARLAERGLPFTVCAVPLPAEVRVTQWGFNIYVWMEHLKKALQRLAGLGCARLVWSEGRARILPVEGELAGLKDQVLQFLFMLCEVAANFRITVLVEPLSPRRTNFLNSMREIGEFLPRVGKENLSSMISLRELESIDLPLDRLGDHRHMIHHVQLENPRAGEGVRVCPRPSDGYDYRSFFRALKDIGYSGGIGLPNDADAEALAYCRQQWEQA